MNRFDLVSEMIDSIDHEVENLGYVSSMQPELDYVMSIVDEWYGSYHSNYEMVDLKTLNRSIENHLDFLESNGYEMEYRQHKKWLTRHS